MATIKIKLVKSLIGKSPAQKKVVEALGLRKMNHVVEHEDNAAIRGMIAKVPHMLEVSEK